MKDVMAKKRNPQDTTLRNIRALKKRVRMLEIAMRIVVKQLAKKT